MHKYRRNKVRGTIWKNAFRTIPRLGIPVLLFLCIGSFFLFSAGAVFCELQGERQKSYELSILAQENTDYNAILHLPNVENLSPVLRLEGKMDYQDYSLSCPILAVSKEYPELDLVQGAMYPEESNMPFLVVNEAAAKGFRIEDDTNEIEISANTEIYLTVSGESCKAVVCGIFRDELESPAAYISYNTANQHWPVTGEGEVLLRLTNRGSLKHVIRDLEQFGLNVSYDPDVARAWELLQEQLFRESLTGGLLWICVGVLLARQKREEKEQYEREQEALLLCGMTPQQTRKIYPLRIALANSFCVGIAAGTAAIAGSFTVFSLILCLGTGGVQCLALGKE